MKNLLKIEWLKIKNYTAFKVMLAFFAVGVVLSNYIVYAINKAIVADSGGANILLSSFKPYSFNSTWQSTSYTAGYLLLLPAMLLVMLVTNEYTFKTHRQNVIDGWSRQQFIMVKLTMALILTIISTLLVFFTALSFGLASGTSFSTAGISHVGYFFLKALTYNLFGILVSVLIKKTGFAMGVLFIYIGAENFISQLINMYSVKIKFDHKVDVGSIGNYLPLNAADGLLTFPDNPMTSLADNAFATNYTWAIFAFAIAYILLFTWWCRHKYTTADL
jgi:ABC-2 type transport system permease protein